MEIREKLELVDVTFENESKKAVLTFLDAERGEIRVVNFNKQTYEDGKYVDSADKSAKVEEWCKTYFNCSFSSLSTALGTKHDIYVYPTFNSLFEVDMVEKFDADMEGCIYNTSIKEITIDDIAIRIRYEIEGKTYESKMTFAKYLENMKQWFVDPNKKAKTIEKFEDKFNCQIFEIDTLVGHPIIVEVKKAFGTALYGDIKKFPKKK